MCGNFAPLFSAWMDYFWGLYFPNGDRRLCTIAPGPSETRDKAGLKAVGSAFVMTGAFIAIFLGCTGEVTSERKALQQ